MHPVFPYFGSKWRATAKVPQPLVGLPVFEPFGGSATYSLRHRVPAAQIIEYREDVVAAWDWFLNATPADVDALPDLVQGEELEHPFARFFTMPGSAKVGGAVTARGAAAQRIYERSKRLARARPPWFDEWSVVQGDYQQAPDQLGTWFLDPPYPGFGKHFGCPELDREAFWAWVRTRRGQVIVIDGLQPPDDFPYSTWLQRGGTSGKQRRQYLVSYVALDGLPQP